MRSEVTSPIYTIDHLMVGACDLELGKAWVTRKLGAMAIDGGCHAGQGTRNAIAGLAHQCYLEVIAPDPAQELKGTFGEKLLGYKAPRLRAFAVGCDSFDDLVPAIKWLRSINTACSTCFAKPETARICLGVYCSLKGMLMVRQCLFLSSGDRARIPVMISSQQGA